MSKSRIKRGEWEFYYVGGKGNKAHVWRLVHNGQHVTDVTCMANGCNKGTPGWILKALSKGAATA